MAELPALQRLAVILCLLAASSGLLVAQDATVSEASSGIPGDFSAALQDSLNSQGYEVQLGGSPLGRFWFAEQLSLSDTAANELGVSFGKLQPGSLVGIVELLQPWFDYKNSSIPAGNYSLRYLVQPADGNHMGVSYYRDFLCLIPAAEDAGASQTYSYEEVIALSIETSGVPHPAVMALFPVYEEVSQVKVVKNDLDQWTLAVPFESNTLGLVVLGHGEIGGY